MASKKSVRRGLRRWFRTIPGITVAAILMTTAAYAGAAAFSLLSQTVPAGTTPNAGFGPTCVALAMDTSVSAANSSNAEVVYNCTTLEAVSVTTAGSHTPTYNLPSGFTAAFLIPSSAKGIPSSSPSAAACGSFTSPLALTSGNSVALSVGSYDYCFNSNNPGGAITSFTVSWN